VVLAASTDARDNECAFKFFFIQSPFSLDRFWDAHFYAPRRDPGPLYGVIAATQNHSMCLVKAFRHPDAR
jgi:hypothetical protein